MENQEGKLVANSAGPDDSRFDLGAFEADPENYPFTLEGHAYLRAMELLDYEEKVHMDPDERHALREWVSSGNDVLDRPPSRYPFLNFCYPPKAFLDAYREEREIAKATEGMAEDEVYTYLEKYLGFDDEDDEERRRREENDRLHKETPEKAKEVIRKLQRKDFHTGSFLMEKGLYEEWKDYIDSHMEEEVPFEDEW